MPTRTAGRGNSVVLMGGNTAPHRHSAVAVMLIVISIICITITTTYNFLTSHPSSPYHHNILTKVQYYPLHQTPSHTCRKRKALIGSTQGKRHVLLIFVFFFLLFLQLLTRAHFSGSARAWMRALSLPHPMQPSIRRKSLAEEKSKVSRMHWWVTPLSLLPPSLLPPSSPSLPPPSELLLLFGASLH